MDTFAERLKALIDVKNIKQTELADLIGVNSKSINTYVKGRSEPNLDLLKKMAEELETPIEYFFGYISLDEAINGGLSSEKALLINTIRNINTPIPNDTLQLIKTILLTLNHEIKESLDKLSKLDPEGVSEIAKQINKEYSLQKLNTQNK
ncbi:transcriptional regulator, XRE family [Denitrovibrio acetiphilus DSM 12809]|uniref:Transcriptional regulator, XRE family n=1 Tax=Denitrovibrio acetiphilus (strain DSM 12809 / NBRC 114555 / N2460) TaxID=522772 RepID=D4H419_DENA2|nr:helix-turn-helix transcriptional regulator [Denitrovibrio acetiphilus]ADD67330.1 transcriptional regulator, XRE family [Denitrovibrio acetiphilus DSM 12809]